MSSEKKSVTNTSLIEYIKKVASSIRNGIPFDIQQDEVTGQHELIESDTLPSDIEDREAIKKMGFILGEQVEGDPLFIYCQLPRGWKKKPLDNDNPFWTVIVDEKERPRVNIFHKAAFYDRRAFTQTIARISIEIDYDNEEFCFAEIRDGETVLFRTPDYRPSEGEELWQERKKAEKEAYQWVEQNFPDWEDCTAYWDRDVLKID
jgi:hypothetical protein